MPNRRAIAHSAPGFIMTGLFSFWKYPVNSEGYDTWMREDRFLYFDGLRAISILIVMMFHFAPRFGLNNDLTHAGHVGVDLFFVISGFLITTLLIREKFRHGRIHLFLFYMRRALRIFPLYYTVILLHVFLVLFVIHARYPVESAQFISNLKYFLTYTSNWFVGRNDETRTIFYIAWSLAVEEQFYLFWPPVLFLFKGLRWPALLMITLSAVIQMCTLLYDRLQAFIPDLFLTIIVNIPVGICLGVLGSLVLHSSKYGRVLFYLASRRWAVNLSVIFLVAAFLLFADGWLSREVLNVFMAAAVVCLATNRTNLFRVVLVNRVAGSLGRISYGIYLFHMLALNAVLSLPAAWGVGGWGGFALASLLSFAVAWISYEYYESFFLRYKKHFAVSARTPAV